MAEKLKIISLGGLNEIGKNITVLEYGKDIIIVDCGLGFPEDDMYGVDLVIADMTYLVKNKQKIRGLFLTHGHEDHIGGIPYAMQQFNCPIHATRLTAGIVQLKLEEHHLEKTVKLFTHEAGETVKAGCFSVEFIHVNHSIADAVAFAIKTPVGLCVHTGDFKIDSTPIPVSYTHLDVYKRQAQRVAGDDGGGRRLAVAHLTVVGHHPDHHIVHRVYRAQGCLEGGSQRERNPARLYIPNDHAQHPLK